MKKFLIALCCLVLASAAVPSYAQMESREYYQEKYESLVSKVGASGIGVETLLNRWLADYRDDADALLGRFLYYYSKSQSSRVVTKSVKKFLGQDPVLSLADSLGNVSYYFEEYFYDDELFGQAVKAADKMIRAYPDRLDLRFYKIAAFTGYEKENPELAVAELRGLIDYNALQHPEWSHPEYKVNDDFFFAAIQEYCVNFFKYGIPAGYEACLSLSGRMLNYYPDNTMFLNNMGSYYFVYKKDEKEALKYYNKVLKLKKDDNTAIKSCILMARNSKNVKMEKKYLEMMAKYGESETDRKSAQVRLEFLNTKK